MTSSKGQFAERHGRLRDLFDSQCTLKLEWRVEQLLKLKESVRKRRRSASLNSVIY
jgi:hypothetical protein